MIEIRSTRVLTYTANVVSQLRGYRSVFLIPPIFSGWLTSVCLRGRISSQYTLVQIHTQLESIAPNEGTLYVKVAFPNFLYISSSGLYKLNTAHDIYFRFTSAFTY